MQLRIRERRKELGLKQKDFAEQIGVKSSVVCNWETSVALPRVDALPLIAKTLHCSIDELFEET